MNNNGEQHRIQPGWQDINDAVKNAQQAKARGIDLADGADPNGWIVGGDNEVEDTSCFDHDQTHKALPGLSAFRTW